MNAIFLLAILQSIRHLYPYWKREENENVGMRRRLSCLTFSHSVSRSRYCLKHSYILVSVVGIVIDPLRFEEKRTRPKNFRDNAFVSPFSYLISAFPICIYFFSLFFYFMPFVISDVLKWESLIKGRCGKRIVYDNTIHGKLYKHSINKIKCDGDGGGGGGVYIPSGVAYQRVFMYDIMHLQGKAQHSTTHI